MASNVVRVTVSEAQAGVNKFNLKLQELTNQVNAMNIQAKNTEGWWEGATGTSFRSSFDRACKAFTSNMTKTLQAHGQKMLKSAQAQQSQDSSMASKIVRH